MWCHDSDRLRPPACQQVHLVFTTWTRPARWEECSSSGRCDSPETDTRCLFHWTKLSHELWGVNQLNVSRWTVDSPVSADVSDLEINQDKSACLFFFVFVYLFVPAASWTTQRSKKCTCVHCVRVLQLPEPVLLIGPVPLVLTEDQAGPGAEPNHRLLLAKFWRTTQHIRSDQKSHTRFFWLNRTRTKTSHLNLRLPQSQTSNTRDAQNFQSMQLYCP